MSKPVRDSRMTEIGLEIRCSRCREFWPADRDFFTTCGGTWHSWCNACVATWKTESRRAAGMVPRELTVKGLPREAWAPLLSWSNPRAVITFTGAHSQ